MRITIVTVATVVAAVSSATDTAAQLPDPAPFDSVLARVLSDGLVDYAALKAHPDRLDRYVAALGRTDSATVAGAPRQARLAFWINAYNACALTLVRDHYPIKPAGFPASLVRSLQGVPANSIRQIPDTWNRKFCPVAGKDRALDEIEHQIIRPMGEPRIHFAVNCAARSCPVLAPEAYRGGALDEQLDAAVGRLIRNREHYRLERGERPTLYLNKVLDWYSGDFGGVDGVVSFLLPYLPPDDAQYIRERRSDLEVEFAEYDWTLNDTAIWRR